MKFILKTLAESISVTGIANVHLFEFPQNYSTENDKHPFYELLFLSSGRLEIESESYSGVLEKDCMIIHPANEYHSLKCVSRTAPTVIIIGFDLKGFKTDKFSSPVKLEDNEIKKLAEIVKEGRNVFAPPYNVPVYDMKKKKNSPFGSEQLLKNLLEYFLVSLIRKYSEEEKEERKGQEKLSASEIISYIDVNYKEKITLDELAFIFRTNRSTLCKEFKSGTGKTITEYVADKKLLRAMDKIKNTDKTFTEIAEQLNFESIHYFTRFFKKMTGVSPKEFRKDNQNRKNNA